MASKNESKAVQWAKWSELINPSFFNLVNNQDRYLILYGGRGSSKSDFAAKKMVYRCLTEKYFRYVLIRNTYSSIKDSSYQNIKDTIYSLGLEELFEFKLQPLEIHCKNGNSFLARGCDDTLKLKSIKDATGIWYEEDIISENDFITITTGIRTLKATYLQEIFTINPEVEGNFQENWFWIKFFKDKPVGQTFSDSVTLKIDENESVDMNYTVHHSTYKDNRWLPKEFKAFLMQLKITNPYYWDVYCNGNWGNRVFGGLFYKGFNVAENVVDREYNELEPLHIAFDFNVNPYMSLSIWQLSGSSAYLIDEIAMKYPDNSTKATCREFARKYYRHIGGVIIYGDPAGKAESTKTDAGHNEFSQIATELSKFNPSFRVPNRHPSVKTRGDWINACFDGTFPKVRIYIHEKSVYLKNDLMFGKEAASGGKHKETSKDDNGVRSQKYHHFSDGMDYMLCEAFKAFYNEYQEGCGLGKKRVLGARRKAGRNKM